MTPLNNLLGAPSRGPRTTGQEPRGATTPRDSSGMVSVRLAQCEPGATQSTPPRAVRAQRNGIRLRSIRASPFGRGWHEAASTRGGPCPGRDFGRGRARTTLGADTDHRPDHRKAPG